MENIIKFENISAFIELLNQPKLKHPLIGIVDFSKVDFNSIISERNAKIEFSFYTVLQKNLAPGSIKYGRNYYDFQDGSLFFISPNQVITIEDPTQTNEIYGWGLFFHPDLIRRTSLQKKIKEYTFFNYSVNEALHLSDEEKSMLRAIISSMEFELDRPIDKHSKAVISSSIELLLNHCMRYYDRQFITRSEVNNDVVTEIENFLLSYFGTDLPQLHGLPTVKQCAEQVNLSSNYLTDLLKKETGKSTQEHIHFQVMEIAKDRLLSSNDTVGEIAYNLGFEYPQYFSKMFKKNVGVSPAEYRNIN